MAENDTESIEELEHRRDQLRHEIGDKVILEYLQEQRQNRRWRTLRRSFMATMIAVGLIVYAGTLAGSLGYRVLPTSESVAVVPVNGVISNISEASAESLIIVLDKMFETDNVKGIVLLIDSGGGSPGEAERIYRFIERKKAETGKPVYAACANVCASAAYMIALHTDGIYAGEYSWVGSIGAVMKGWDFKGVMERFDIEQRVFASGSLKDLMNPYTAISDLEEAKAASLVNDTADIFIADVKAARGERLSDDRDLFTGEVWTGPESVQLGLVDELGTLEDVLEKHFDGLHAQTYRPKKRGNTLFDSILGQVGAAMANALVSQSYRVEM